MILFGTPVATYQNLDMQLHADAAAKMTLTQPLERFILKSVEDFAKELGVGGCFEAVKWWVVDMKFGMQNSIHIHPDSDVSCVYYLDVSSSSAPLSLVDQRPSSIFTDGFGTKSNGESVGGYKLFNIHPIVGELVVFPSYLPHFVSTKIDDAPRVCLSVNLKLKRS